MHKLPFPISGTIYSKALEVLYSDIWGPSLHPYFNGYYYYILVSLGSIYSKHKFKAL